MNLHIANCSKQNFHFNYRLPEQTRLFERTIPAGQQIVINDLSTDHIDEIIRQHKPYGFARATEIGRKGFAGLAYEIDKPVKLDGMLELFDANETAMTERATAMRAGGLEAARQTIADAGVQAGADNLAELSIDVIEQRAPGDQRETEPFRQTVSTKPERGNGGKNNKGRR